LIGNAHLKRAKSGINSVDLMKRAFKHPLNFHPQKLIASYVEIFFATNTRIILLVH